VEEEEDGEKPAASVAALAVRLLLFLGGFFELPRVEDARAQQVRETRAGEERDWGEHDD